MEQGQGILIIIVLFYFLPAIISIFRQLQNSNTICLLNLLLGWTLIGWVCAFIAALSSKTRAQQKQEDIKIVNATTQNLQEAYRILQDINNLEKNNSQSFEKGGTNFEQMKKVIPQNEFFKDKKTHHTFNLKPLSSEVTEKQNNNRRDI